MSSFGRLSLSTITGINENTLALANFNLDFSLFKVEAPKVLTHPLNHCPPLTHSDPIL
jgi:hypothetical protein